MDIEFHYYITYVLARRTKFTPDEAFVLAYSSQYTDDNCYHYFVNRLDGSHYISEVSQTMDLTKPSLTRQTIYPVFHFMPGDSNSTTARREDGKIHPLNTIPGNQNASKLLDKALQSKDLYRIGVATHCYADTWAHQNFVGILDEFNRMRGIESTILPLCHAEALHEPDKVRNEWKDERLAEGLQLIDNNERFLDAAKHIFKAYWNRPGMVAETDKYSWESHWNDLLPQLKDAMEESFLLIFNSDVRKRAYGKLCEEGIPSYDPEAWRRAALDKRELEIDLFDRYWAKEGFDDSAWFQFQRAVDAHRRDALAILRPLFEKAGCPLHT
jgi:hypothetical protein